MSQTDRRKTSTYHFAYHLGNWVQELPQIPENEWCDFRRDFCGGMTLKAIGEKYCCDPRTVRRCILDNRSSNELGKQTAPRKLEPFLPHIERLLDTADSENRISGGIIATSRKIHEELLLMGFSGCERTVRNYLNNRLNDPV